MKFPQWGFSLLVYAATVVACLITSCDDSIVAVMPSASPLLLPVTSIPNAGELHNMGVTYVRPILDTTSYGSPQAGADSISTWLIHYYVEEGEWTDLPGTDSGEVALMSGNFSVVDNWQTFSHDSVTEREYSMISSAFARVESVDTVGRTFEEVAQEYASIADSLTSVWTNTNWVDNEGEGFGGYASILGGSASYWMQNPPSLVRQKAGSEMRKTVNWVAAVIIIKVDAAGYLAGWLDAVDSEISRNGRLDSRNERSRIQAGLKTAGQWSLAATAWLGAV